MQTASLQIAGGVPPYRATLDTPLASVSAGSSSNQIILTASQQTGSATLTVTDSSGLTASAPVRVAYDAGNVPTNLVLQVTGNPAGSTWLREQLARTISAAAQLLPGARLVLGAADVPALSPGGVAAVPVPVQIAGGSIYYDVNAATNVTIKDLAVPQQPSTLLMYDDDPEKITQDGTLYTGSVAAGTPARLYYYHQNALGFHRLLVVLQSATASSVQLIDASAGPNEDVMSVGHVVSRNYVERKARDEGLVESLEPGVPLIVDAFDLGPLQGAAGSIGIHVLSGGPVNVSVRSVPAGTPDTALSSLPPQTQLPDDGHHRTGLFNVTDYGQQQVLYTVGGADASVQYGAGSPPSAGMKGGHDYGDYGVVRTVVFHVINPSAQPATLYLYERPLGGSVRSSFLVNGTMVEVGCARLAQRYAVGSPFSVAAGGSTTLNVTTMTDGGSSYPIELGITATPPPSTPPVRAPDGCFPAPAVAPSSPAPEPTG